MPRRADEHDPEPADVHALLAGVPPEHLLSLLEAVAMSGLGPTAAEATPSRLQPPLDTVHSYRVRVDIDRMSPPIWRRLELASDLPLDVVHDVLQAAFGWTDSHLHQFSVGDSARDRRTERFLTPFDLIEGEVGVAEEDVRLDQVLRKAGDRLFYTYDFGDDWEHTLRLEAVVPRDDGAPRAQCTGGRRAGPPEDVGGVWGYYDVLAALDGDIGDDLDLLDRVELPGHGYDPAAFDRDAVNGMLRLVTRGTRGDHSIVRSLQGSRQGDGPTTDEARATTRSDETAAERRRSR
jgi:hypothetical protein